MCAGARAQEFTPATPEQKTIMLEKITTAAKQIKSLVCEFEQTKELVGLNEKVLSKGTMYYRYDRCVRWEYHTPYPYTFVFNNHKMLMQTDSHRTVMDVKSNKLFHSIVNIMISGMNGSGLTDTKNFEAQFYRSNRGWMVALTPLQKDVKQLFSAIKLFFNATDYAIDTVCMEEKSGDATTIRLLKKQVNEKIDAEKFRVD